MFEKARGKLQFKGEVKKKVVKKSKKKHKEVEKPIWCRTERIQDLSGPIIIINNKKNLLNVVQGIDALSFKTPKEEGLAEVEDSNKINEELKDKVDEHSLLPTLVSQVWQVHSLGSSKFTIKSCYDKYFSSTNNSIKCNQLACSQPEIFTIEKHLNGFVIRDFQLKYINFTSSTLDVVDEVAPGCVVEIYNQDVKKIVKEQELSVVDIELEQMKKYHSFGVKEIRAVDRNVLDLKDAKLRGKVNEVLVDRRAKYKGDKFCW